ncbi:hypothetical protein GCM10023174_17160 [Chelativorans composti]
MRSTLAGAATFRCPLAIKAQDGDIPKGMVKRSASADNPDNSDYFVAGTGSQGNRE